MNKKFSTLVASILLASSVGAYAATTPTQIAGINVTANTLSAVTPSIVKNYNAATDPKGGYFEGQSYFLGFGGNNYLAVDGDNYLSLVDVSTFYNIKNVDKALWTLKKITSSVGAIPPTYVFENKFSKVTLSLDTRQAVKLGEGVEPIQLGGEQAEWLSAFSYKEPVDAVNGNAIYAAAPNDEVYALASTVAANGKKIVYLAKTSKNDLTNSTSEVLKVNPYQAVNGISSLLTLSPQQLNTMLGAAGTEATKDSYFSLGFPAGTTVNGKDNIWGQDLQAIAVDQFESAYGRTADDKEVSTNLYASLYPKSSKTAGVDAFKDVVKAENVNGFNESSAQWVALRNRDGKYLVVDTAFVNGTEQTGAELITFKFDDLYNAKNETRFRDPRSYLFRVDYNASSGNVEIHSLAYLKAAGDKNTIPFDEVAFNQGNYATQPIKKDSRWYTALTNVSNSTYDAQNSGDYERALDPSFIRKAVLGSVIEVTAGLTGGANNTNLFNIKLGNSGIYNPTTIGSGAYLIKVVASKDADRVGKYWVNNLKGGFEIREEAARQNFQDMPSAQWIVKTVGSTVSSIANREFTGAPSGVQVGNDWYSVFTAGNTSYGTGISNQAFFAGKDTLEFIRVSAPNDEYLGYKYVSTDSIKESNFTFNYLHELAMDKPINTKNEKDSVVWVDNAGNAMKFVLEKVLDDTYGTNGNLAGVKNLVRRAYKIRVNDATKLQNDGRYLYYDEAKKKYVVSKTNSTEFFLKENNEVEGGACYYTLVIPSYMDNLMSVAKVNGVYDYTTAAYVGGKIVHDNDVSGLFQGTDEIDGIIDPETGVPGKGRKLMTYTHTYVGSVWTEITNANIGDINAQSYDWQYEEDTDGKFVRRYKELLRSVNYASSKVSVDNNTLDLVNGDIYDDSGSEVANSAFAVKRDADPLYRRFNTAFEGVAATDAPDTVKFYRVNATNKEYLYEDANSAYSKDKNFNFLGVEDKGVTAKSAMYVDTAYIHDNVTRMPQYLLAVDVNHVQGETILCDATTHSHATEAEALACPHTKITPTYTDARYLVNLQDSVDLNTGLVKAKYQWNNAYTRLGFVDARRIGDTLVIKNSIYTGNTKPIKIGEAKTIASKDSILLNNNKHKNVVFSFRLLKTGSNDFLIESSSKKEEIAPQEGGWVKIQNGVPVIATYSTYAEAGLDAEIFNVDAANGEKATANDAIDATTVSIEAGNGNVTIKNAEGKNVAISNILGQAIANTVITSDNATITVPAGIVVVSVEGEEAAKVIVK